MGRFIDRTGMRYGRLTVLCRAPAHLQYRSPKGQSKSTWICKCDCGNEVVVNITNLVSGRTNSCGCYREETVYANIHTLHTLRRRERIANARL